MYMTGWVERERGMGIEMERLRERERERERKKREEFERTNGSSEIALYAQMYTHTHLVSPEDCSIPSNADVVGEVQGEISSQVKEVFNTTIVDIHKRTL